MLSINLEFKFELSCGDLHIGVRPHKTTCYNDETQTESQCKKTISADISCSW